MNCRYLSCEQCTVGDPEGPPILRLVGVDKILDGKKVLDNIDLDIPRNRITAIIGLSGAGKSVLLKHMIGLLKPDRGQVLLDGEDLGDFSREELFETRRRFGMLFQSGALFDSLDVFGNVAFPLREKTKLGEEQIRERVQVILRKVGLEKAGEKFPDELSGGTFHDHKFTMVMISHDIPDIFNWCHHVVVVHGGKVIEAGAPKDVRNSVNPFVHQLVQGDIHGPVHLM